MSTDAATLLLAIDSTQVKTGVNELDRLTAAGARAERSSEGVTVATGRQAVAMRSVAQASGQARMGMQQLGYQIGDVGAQYAAGTRPAQIFAQQIGQVQQAVMMMAGSGTKLAAFLGGPWAIAFAAATSVAAIFVSKLSDAKDAADKKKSSLEQLQDAVKAYQESLGKASASEAVNIRLMDQSAAATLNKAVALREATKAQLQQAAAQLATDRGDTKSPDFNRQFRIQGNAEALERINGLLKQQDAAIADAYNTKRITSFNRAVQETAESLDKVKLANSRYEITEHNLREAVKKRTISVEDAKKAIDTAARARDAAIAAANKHEKADNSAAKAAREAAKAAREQAKEIRELQGAYEDLERQFDPAAATARDFMESMKNIEAVRLAGLIDEGKALNFVLAAVFGQAYAIEKTLEKLQKDAGFDPGEPIIKVEDVPQDVIDHYERIAEAIRRANDNLLDMASYLQSIGGLAGAVGGIFEGALTGNFRGLGPVGLLINQLNMGPGGTEKQIANLTRNLNDIFGIGGQFGKDLATHLTQALNGAAIGAVANSAILGKSGSGTGGAVGGALGNIAGGAFQKSITAAATSAFGTTLGTALGTAVPVIGSIVGGLLGGALGGLFKSTPRGEATISGSGVFVAGNSGQFEAAAGDAANGVIDALNALAGDLGGWVDKTLGSVTVSVRDGNWRVDPSGMGISKKSNGAIDFGQDGDAAIAFAVQELINDGVIKGLRDSTMNLLKSGDFEQQLEKALAFEAVFQQLEAQANPFTAALREMQAGFAELTKVFNEAGATAGEFAVLQELQARRLQEIVDQASSSFRSTFFTDAEKLTFAKDQISSVLTPLGFGGVDTVEEYKALVAGVDMASQAGLELFGTLMTLTDEFGAVKDAADAAADAAALAAAAADAEAQAAAAAAQARAQMASQLNIQLLQALGQSEAALTMQRTLELQALDASLRPLQMQVWAAQDASKAMEDVARTTQAAAQTAWQTAEKAAQEASRIEADAIQRVDQAKNDLLATYRRERGELDETASRFRSFGDDLRAFRDSLNGGAALTRSQALVNLMKVGGLAGAGNEQAMGQLPGTAREFLDVSRAGASSLLQYQRDVALVANYVGAGIKAADAQVSNAERQMIALDNQVGRLVDLNEGVLTVRQAIDQLQQAQGSQAVAAEAAARARDEAAARDRAAQLAATQKLVVTNEAMTFSLGTLEKLFKGAIQGDALTVRGDADTPVYTTAAP